MMSLNELLPRLATPFSPLFSHVTLTAEIHNESVHTVTTRQSFPLSTSSLKTEIVPSTAILLIFFSFW